MSTRASKKEPTGQRKSPTRREGRRATNKRRKIRTPLEGRRKKPKKAKKEIRKHLTVAQEQAILSRFFLGETLKSVQSSYIKGLRDEIRNLKNAFEAGEFLFKDDIWQLVS